MLSYATSSTALLLPSIAARITGIVVGIHYWSSATSVKSCQTCSSSVVFSCLLVVYNVVASFAITEIVARLNATAQLMAKVPIFAGLCVCVCV